MNAGMGLVHSERPSKELAEAGGVQEIIQLWVNTPAVNKMDQPYYLALQKEDMATLKPEQGEGEILLVSGELNGKTGNVSTPRPLLSVMAWFKKGATHKFKVPADQHTMMYLLDGALKVDGFGLIDGLQLVEFEAEGSEISFTAN